MDQSLSDNSQPVLRAEPAAKPAAVPAPLRVTGFVPREQSLAPDDVRRLPSRVLGPTEIVCMNGRHIERAGGYRGVSLLEILALTGLPDVPRPALKECVVVACADDGYRALFTWSELYNTPTGDGVLVVYEKNFQRLDDRSGPLGLISAADLRLGPRHLRRLCEVKVVRLPS